MPFLKKTTTIDVIIVILLPIVATVVSNVVQVNFLTSIFLYLGLPSLYISVRTPRHVGKTSLFSLIASVPLIIIISYIGQLSLSWDFPETVFGFKFLGIVQPEAVLWAFLNIYAVVIFYEFFFDQHRKPKIWRKSMYKLVIYLAVWVALFVAVLVATEGKIFIPYFYLLFGIILFFYPIIASAVSYPHILPKLLYTTIYFTYLSLIYEIVALKNGWWLFPGKQFVGYVNIYGTSFPLEELFFWIILFAPAVAAAFEYLNDDRK